MGESERIRKLIAEMEEAKGRVASIKAELAKLLIVDPIPKARALKPRERTRIILTVLGECERSMRTNKIAPYLWRDSDKPSQATKRAWSALGYLAKKGLVESKGVGRWSITEKGRAVLGNG